MQGLQQSNESSYNKHLISAHGLSNTMVLNICVYTCTFLAPAVTVGETKGAMDSTSVFFLPLLLPITL